MAEGLRCPSNSHESLTHGQPTSGGQDVLRARTGVRKGGPGQQGWGPCVRARHLGATGQPPAVLPSGAEP